jgi:glycosyltransferase involved in cell wall biosynthesis
MAKSKKKKNKRGRQAHGAQRPSSSEVTAASPDPAAVHSSKRQDRTDASTQSRVSLQPFGAGPRFSVLMAAYNRAELIHVAIDSVLAQDFKEYELVIVDDGSTDNTGEIVQSYGDPRIRYIRKDQNEGRSPTRNRAISEARGEFVLWMADDDLLAPGLLTLYDRILRDNPAIDVVYGDLQLFDHDTGADLNIFTPNDWTGRARDVIGAKLYGSCVPDGGTATRRTIYSRVGDGPYDDEFVRAQDYELWTRIVGQANFYKVDEVVYRYRKHSGGTSWGDFIDLTLDSKIIRRHLNRHPLRTLFPKLDWSDEAVATSIAYLRVAKNLRIYGDHVNALRFLDAVLGSESQPEAIEHRVRSLVALGDLQAAEIIVEDVPRNMGGSHAVQDTLRPLVDAAKVFRSDAKRALEAGQFDAVINGANAFRYEHEFTCDTMRYSGQAHLGLGDLQAAINCFCLAARLNPDDQESAREVRTLTEHLGFSPKTDLDAMRRRLAERFVDLPEETTPSPISGPCVSVIVTSTTPISEQLIKNVVEQTYENIDILVPEGTPLSDPRMRTISLEEGGTGSMCSSALEQARGEFVAWLDERDYWYPRHLSRCVGALIDGADVAISHGHLHRAESEHVAESFWPALSVFRRAGNLSVPSLSLSLIVHRLDAAAWTQIVEARWAFTLRLLSAETVRLLPYPGGAMALPTTDESVQESSTFERAGELAAVYRQYTRETLFDPAIRKAQNQRLNPIGIYQVERGRTSIVIMGGVDRQGIEACLAHLKANTWVAYSMILLVTDLPESTADWLNELSDGDDELRVIQCAQNLSVAKAINEGLSKANGEYVALMDVGVRPSSGWLGRLQWWGQEHEEYGALCPDFSLEPMTSSLGEAHREAHWGSVDTRQRLDPRCLILRRDALDRVGGMDVVLGADGYEWDDFSLRLRIGGFGLGQARDVLVAAQETHKYENERATRRFVARWGSPPDAVLNGVLPSFDAGEHHCRAGAEEGFRPDARPVTVSEAKERNVLINPPWDNPTALSALVTQLAENERGSGIWLRAPVGGGTSAVQALSDTVRSIDCSVDDLPDVLVIDAHLAPEREGGLYTAADAIFTSDDWPSAAQTIRRGVDCGRQILRGYDELSAWLSRS